MSYQTLTLARNEAVLTLTVNRPEVLNAQSRIMLEEFDQAMAQAAEDDASRWSLWPAPASIFRPVTISAARRNWPTSAGGP